MGRARSDAPRDPHPSPPHDAHAQPRPTSWLRGSSQGARTAAPSQGRFWGPGPARIGFAHRPAVLLAQAVALLTH